ncbi:MAG TPA: hypothetical protein VKN18_12200 [Blastocatellia bacterium]|nr:hypothetical protein [Blastocatellia bacterium]
MKLAVGWVATMSALILGLLVNSAKTNYDAQRNTVIQLSAKISLLDRALGLYGSEANETRVNLRAATEELVNNLWEDSGTKPVLNPETQAGASIYIAISSFSPRDDAQRMLKTQTLALTAQIAELRALMISQSVTYISRPLLVVLIAWLVVVFLTFSVIAPRSVTALTILIISALSISGAIFLIVELDRPFSGLIRIPNEPLLRALSNMGK